MHEARQAEATVGDALQPVRGCSRTACSSRDRGPTGEGEKSGLGEVRQARNGLQRFRKRTRPGARLSPHQNWKVRSRLTEARSIIRKRGLKFRAQFSSFSRLRVLLVSLDAGTRDYDTSPIVTRSPSRAYVVVPTYDGAVVSRRSPRSRASGKHRQVGPPPTNHLSLSMLLAIPLRQPAAFLRRNTHRTFWARFALSDPRNSSTGHAPASVR